MPNRKEGKSRSRSESPKSSTGCKTSRTNYPQELLSSQFSHICSMQEKNLDKMIGLETGKKRGIKITDLCSEDKERIVDLIEELTKSVDKNKALKEKIDRLKRKQQDQECCIMKQATLHLEEKNIFMKEVEGYKAKIAGWERENKEKTSKWETYERFIGSEICCLAKSLQKALDEKQKFHEEASKLRSLLQQSVDSLKHFKIQMLELQEGKSKGTVACQTNHSCRRENMTVKVQRSVASQTTWENSEQAAKIMCVLCRTEQKRHKRRSGRETACQTEWSESSSEYFDSEQGDNGVKTASPSEHDVFFKNHFGDIDEVQENIISILQIEDDMMESKHLPRFVKEQTTEMNRPPDTNVPLKKRSSRTLFEQLTCLLGQDEQRETRQPVEGHVASRKLNPLRQCGRTSVQAERILETLGKPFLLTTMKHSDADLDNYIDSLPPYLVNSKQDKRKLLRTTKEQSAEDRLFRDLFYAHPSPAIDFDLSVCASRDEQVSPIGYHKTTY